ncbi:hypothetical protein PV325_006501 [Microctonus aethiopoides]|nr:hypothetical protein PV325_006501 [Microctonus aethiopoides]
MSILLEARPYRPFKSSEEYLIAMKEDLAEWLNALYPELRMNPDNFMDRLDTGVAICKNGIHDFEILTKVWSWQHVAKDAKSLQGVFTESLTSHLLSVVYNHKYL